MSTPVWVKEEQKKTIGLVFSEIDDEIKIFTNNRTDYEKALEVLEVLKAKNLKEKTIKEKSRA